MREKIKKEIFMLDGISCIFYGATELEYLLIQPVNEPHAEILDQQVQFMRTTGKHTFCLAAFCVKDWNRDLTPWSASAVFGKENFGNDAANTLNFTEKVLMPEIRKRYGIGENTPVILGGYSLAGLFALWSAYQTETQIFSAVAAMSPSVWYPGWMEYMKKNHIQTKCIYLSLGDREEKTRNTVMAQVGKNIRETQKWLTEKENADCLLEWNEGNHFQDTDVRCGKGLLWCMEKLW